MKQWTRFYSDNLMKQKYVLTIFTLVLGQDTSNNGLNL